MGHHGPEGLLADLCRLTEMLEHGGTRRHSRGVDATACARLGIRLQGGRSSQWPGFTKGRPDEAGARRRGL